MTDLNRNSTADTVLLTLRDTADADLAVDLSQERTDLDDQTTYAVELSSARAALTSPREVTVLFTAQTGDSGILVNHGTNNGASYTYRVQVSGGNLVCRENGSTIVTLALPSLTGSDRSFAAQWSTRPTDSGVRSEVTICCLDTGALAYGFAAHAAAATDPTWELNVAGYGSGASAYPLGKIDGVRLGKRFHSQAEFVEAWVAESTAPPVTGVLRGPVLPVDPDTTIGDEGGFAGPAYLWAGAAARDADRRLLSPLVNQRAAAEYLISKGNHSDGRASKYRPAPGFPTYWLGAQHWFYVPVPPNVNEARVQVFVRMLTTGVGPCDMLFRAYSLAGLQFVGEPAAELRYHVTDPVVLNADHGSGGGEWVDLGRVRLARDEWGMTSICVAHSFDLDVDSPAADDTLFCILAVRAEPVYVAGDAGGFDLAP